MRFARAHRRLFEPDSERPFETKDRVERRRVIETDPDNAAKGERSTATRGAIQC